MKLCLDHLIFPQRKDVLRKPKYGVYEGAQETNWSGPQRPKVEQLEKRLSSTVLDYNQKYKIYIQNP